MDTEKDVAIDMDEHFGSFSDSVSVLSQERFAMPPVVVAALRQAGKMATLRMLQIMQDDKKFNALKPTEQMKLMEMVMDRAYGRAETASSSLNLLARTGQLQGTENTTHSAQLAEIEKRMEERAVKYPEMRSITSDAVSQETTAIEKRDEITPEFPAFDSNVESIAEAAARRNERRAAKNGTED